MTKYIIIAVLALASMGARAETINDLVAKLPPAESAKLQSAAIVQEALANADFYAALKANAWTFDGVTLTEGRATELQFKKGEYADIAGLAAAKYLSFDRYKTWASAKVLALGETTAAYDWLQEQRLVVVQSQVKDYAQKQEFLGTVADQVIAAAKAKQ